MGPRTRSEDLARLLARRVAATEQPLDGEVSVAELRRRLVPYEVARADLALATKAEYDLALLELLAGDEHLKVEDEELAGAARKELDSPEPGLAFLQDFAASHLRLRLEGLAAKGVDGSPATAGAAPAGSVASGAGGSGGSGAGGSGAEASRTGTGASAAGSGPEAAGPGDEASPSSVGVDACWSCGEDVPSGADEARFCVWCGSDLQLRPCGECGADLQVEWRYCPRCGEEAA